MTTKKPDSPSYSRMLTIGESSFDYRAQAAAKEEHKIELRRQHLAEQTSELNTPDKRIRIWEQLHVLDLPLEQAHPLLGLIARETGLTMEQVQTEQQQRLAMPKSGPDKASVVKDPYCVLTGGAKAK